MADPIPKGNDADQYNAGRAAAFAYKKPVDTTATTPYTPAWWNNEGRKDAWAGKPTRTGTEITLTDAQGRPLPKMLDSSGKPISGTQAGYRQAPAYVPKPGAINVTYIPPPGSTTPLPTTSTPPTPPTPPMIGPNGETFSNFLLPFLLLSQFGQQGQQQQNYPPGYGYPPYGYPPPGYPPPGYPPPGYPPPGYPPPGYPPQYGQPYPQPQYPGQQNPYPPYPYGY